MCLLIYRADGLTNVFRSYLRTHKETKRNLFTFKVSMLQLHLTSSSLHQGKLERRYSLVLITQNKGQKFVKMEAFYRYHEYIIMVPSLLSVSPFPFLSLPSSHLQSTVLTNL